MAVLALIGFAGLGVLLWQRRTAPLTIAEAPVVRDAVSIRHSSSKADWWNAALDAARRVDVNAATVAELERLPEVGPSLARRIAAYRETHGPFGSPEDLVDVPGIGPKTYDVLKDYVSAE